MKVMLALLLAGCFDPDIELPACADMGCDGTQEVPLYCPDHPGRDGQPPVDGSCFCAAPDGPDGWCVP